MAFCKHNGGGLETCPACKRESSKSELSGLLNAPVRFGLAGQKKVGVVGKMLAEGRTWDEIGEAIGWCGETAKRHWLKIMERI